MASRYKKKHEEHPILLHMRCHTKRLQCEQQTTLDRYTQGVASLMQSQSISLGVLLTEVSDWIQHLLNPFKDETNVQGSHNFADMHSTCSTTHRAPCVHNDTQVRLVQAQRKSNPITRNGQCANAQLGRGVDGLHFLKGGCGVDVHRRVQALMHEIYSTLGECS